MNWNKNTFLHLNIFSEEKLSYFRRELRDAQHFAFNSNWQTSSGLKRAPLKVGLSGNSSQSTTCLGLTRNAETNGKHVFPPPLPAFFTREYAAVLGIAREFSRNDDLRVGFAFCNWHIEPDGVHCQRFCKRGDFANNQHGFRGSTFYKNNISECNEQNVHSGLCDIYTLHYFYASSALLARYLNDSLNLRWEMFTRV